MTAINKLFFAFFLVLGLLSAASVSINGTVVFAHNGSYANATNVSIYSINMLNGAETLINSTLTNSTGWFSLGYDNSTVAFLTFKAFWVNSTGAVNYVSNALVVSPTSEFEKIFLTQANLSLTTGLVAGSTLFVNATNSTGSLTNFSYSLTSVSNVITIKAEYQNTVSNFSVNIPSNKSYVLSIWSSGSFPKNVYISANNLTNNTVNGTYYLEVSLNDTIAKIEGNLSVTGNSSAVNFTGFRFVPITLNKVYMGPNSNPIDPITSSFLQSYDSSLGATLGNYTIYLPASASGGTDYLMMVYASDGTLGANVSNYMAIQPITLTTSNLTLNLTLRPMVGEWLQTGYAGEINSSNYAINLNQTQTGQLITTSDGAGFLSLNVSNYNATGSFSVIMEFSANSSGYFLFPVINDSNVTFELYSQSFSPKKGILNLSVNSTLLPVSAMQMSTPDGNIFDSISVSFYESNATCNVPVPSDSCSPMTSFTVSGAFDWFNPFAFTLYGKNPNLLIEESTSGVKVYLISVDLIASGPPNAEFDQNATGSQLLQARRIGSMAPQVYTDIYVGFALPADVNVGLPVYALLTELYNDNWVQIWNSTGDPSATNIPAYYSDYNISLLNSTDPALCSTADKNAICYLDTASRAFWINIPHFSGSNLRSTFSLLLASDGAESSDPGTMTVTTAVSCDGDNTLLTVTVKEGSNLLDGAEVRVISSGLDPQDTVDGLAVFTFTLNSDKVYNLKITKSGYSNAYVNNVAVPECEAGEEVPEVPEVPETPETPEVPETPETPETPEPPVIPEDPEFMASQAIAMVQYEIELAKEEGKLTEDAEAKLLEAQDAYDEGNYELAQQLAEEALTLIAEPQAPEPEPEPEPEPQPQEDNSLLIYLGGLVILGVLVGGYFLLKGKR